MKKVLSAIGALLVMSSVATAAQIGSGTILFTSGGTTVELDWTAHDDPGGGLTRYDVFIDDPLNNSLSYFLGALGFTGLINQDKAGSKNTIIVNSDDSALAFDGLNYDMTQDSFFFQPFTDNPVSPGITDSAAGAEGVLSRTYAITAGSGGGSALDYWQIAQIVASGDVAVAGALARNGVNCPGQGTMTSTPIPEPSTLVLLGLGVVGLVGLARRKR